MTFEMAFLEHKCIEPLGESKSDYEIVCMVAERLRLLQEYTEARPFRSGSGTALKPADPWGRSDHLGEVPGEPVLRGALDPDWENSRQACSESIWIRKNPLTTPSASWSSNRWT